MAKTTKPRTKRTAQRAREDATAKAKERFLAKFRDRANVTRAAAAAKVGRRTVYDWREEDPAFEAEYQEAREDAYDTLEDEAWRRARDGTLRPVFQGGHHVGQVREYSDTLLLALLKAHKPDEFKDRTSTELSGPGGAPLAQGLVQIYLPGNNRDELEEETTVEVAAS